MRVRTCRRGLLMSCAGTPTLYQAMRMAVSDGEAPSLSHSRCCTRQDALHSLASTTSVLQCHGHSTCCFASAVHLRVRGDEVSYES